MTTATLAFRLGEPDWECRYPVLIGDDVVIGAVFRWHRDWIALTSQGDINLGRPESGNRSVRKAAAHAAAAHVVNEYANGRITVMSREAVTSPVPVLAGPVPLLHPRMPETPNNIKTAKEVTAVVRQLRFTPFTGFAGSDNPQWQECQLCGWQGPRYWSHQRRYNGRNPSIHRHPASLNPPAPAGCVGEEKVRELISLYGK
ncbi:hypothetical protein [Streptomyces sp. NPDC001068]|uniref:hypothetical protein n=1 Tax=Streptomyces sp. NPDC001068 TaxID=3364544 RepID=UPI0036A6329B